MKSRGKKTLSSRATSYDEATHTIDIVYSTGAAVERYDDMTGAVYLETLEISDESIIATRLDAGAVPLMLNHDEFSTPVGIVIDHWIQDGAAWAKVRLSEDPANAGIVKDIISGVRGSVSVGYMATEYEEHDEDGVTYRHVTKLEPHEISIVNIPADPYSQARSKGASAPGLLYRSLSRKAPAATTKGKNMTKPNTTTKRTTKAQQTRSTVAEQEAIATDVVDEILLSDEVISDVAEIVAEEVSVEVTDADAEAAVETAMEEAAVVVEDVIAEAIKEIEEEEEAPAEGEGAGDAAAATDAERKRAASIMNLAARSGIPANIAARHVAAGTRASTFRRAVASTVAQRSARPVNTARAQVLRDERVTFFKRAMGAVTAQMTRGNIPAESREMMGMGILDFARHFVGNEARGMSRDNIIRRAIELSRRGGAVGSHTTADFVGLMSASANKALLAGYESEPQTFDAFVQRVTHRDFKQVEKIRRGDMPGFRKRAEKEEVQFGTFGESMEAFAIHNEAIAISLSRQMMINDDLGAFGDLVSDFGASAADAESDLVYDILTGRHLNDDGTPYVMSDGHALFSAAHNNLADVELSVAGLSLGRQMMMKQTSKDGRRITVRPAILAVGPDLLTDAEQLLSDIMPVTADGVNPFSKAGLTLVSDGRIEGNEWYLAAAPTRLNTIQLANLEGSQGVDLVVEPNPYTASIDYIASMDMGAAPIDHRGLFKSTGG